MRSNIARLSALAAAVAVTGATLSADETAAPADAATAQRFTLRYKFAAVQVLHYEVQNASNYDVQVGGVADFHRAVSDPQVDEDGSLAPEHDRVVAAMKPRNCASV